MDSSAQRFSLTSGGYRIEGYSWPVTHAIGRVLLLHGWNGRASQLGAFVEPLNAAGFSVIGLDAPAHGRSSGRATTLLHWSAAIAAIQEQQGPLHAAIAHSFGVHALAQAVREGLKLRCAVCIGSPAGMATMLARYTNWLKLSAHATDRLQQRLRRRLGAPLWDRIRQIDGPARDAGLPALFIHDQDDRDVPWQQGEAAARLWGDAEFLLTEKLGHRRVLRADRVTESACRFIRERTAVNENPVS